MDEFPFGGLQIDDAADAAKDKQPKAPLPAYVPNVQRPRWFLDRPATLEQKERNRKESSLKRDAQTLVHSVNLAYFECRTPPDYRRCLELARKVLDEVVEKRALPQGDLRALEETIVRCAMRVEDWDLAKQHATALADTRDPAINLLLGQLHSRIAGRLPESFMHLQICLSAPGFSSDYLAVRCLAEALLGANSESIVGTCLLDVSTATLWRSLSGRQTSELDQHEARLVPEADATKMNRDRLVDSLVARGVLDTAPADSNSLDAARSINSELSSKARDALLRLHADRTRVTPFDFEIALLDDSQIEWLGSRLALIGSSQQSDTVGVDKSPLDL